MLQKDGTVLATGYQIYGPLNCSWMLVIYKMEVYVCYASFSFHKSLWKISKLQGLQVYIHIWGLKVG